MRNKYEERVARLQAKFAEAGIDGLYISHVENVSYFTGKKGNDCTLWITPTRATIITDFRYREMAQELTWLTFYETGNAAKPIDVLKACPYTKIGVERDYLPLSDYLDFTKQLEGKEIIPVEGLVEDLRMVKDEEEMELTRQAEEISAQAFLHMLDYLKPGVSERDAAVELEHWMLTHGGEGISFDTICVSGAKSSYPHGVPDSKLIEAGDFVTMDYGTMVGGYHADMTRTVAIGYATEEMKRVYEVVRLAQQTCCDKIRAGMMGDECHRIASDIIEQAGYGEYFGHGLGHGTGLEIHETPRFSPAYPKIIKENTIMSIEPGIYLPGKFGIRIEDLCIVKADGIINLTLTAPKELIII
ncbi:MAG: aminopeptidase P family protein [Firmicutes bacterium]|nr:aminopeptidase P family protein [Bacillota bacterium]